MQGDYFCSGLVISRDVFSHFCLKFREGKLLQLEAYFEDCLDSTTGERWCMGPHRISAAQRSDRLGVWWHDWTFAWLTCIIPSLLSNSGSLWQITMHEHDVCKRAKKTRDHLPLNANLDHKWIQFSSPWLGCSILVYWQKVLVYWQNILNSRLFQAALAFQKEPDVVLFTGASSEGLLKSWWQSGCPNVAWLFGPCFLQKRQAHCCWLNLASLPILQWLSYHFSSWLVCLFHGKISQKERSFSAWSSVHFFPPSWLQSITRCLAFESDKKNTRLFFWPMMILRLICVVIVGKSLSDGCLFGCEYYKCEVDTDYRNDLFGRERAKTTLVDDSWLVFSRRKMFSQFSRGSGHCWYHWDTL